MKLTAKLFYTLLLSLSLSAQAANPELDWMTYETPNFFIHYPSELYPFVGKVEALSEQSHESLSEFFKWQPKNKTHIVLLDDFDQTNGYAQPMPNNTMTLFMQPPTSGELLVYDDWLKLLIHHEYTHILHMDKVLGFPDLLRKVFGRIFFTFPNALHPNWFAEGLATYQETQTEQGIGRGQSSLFEIMMRAEVETGIKPLSRINTVAAHDWPLNTAYLYGVYFFKFIHDVYGEDAIKALVNNYSNNIVPFMVGSNTRLVTGKTLDRLWPDFEAYLKGYFAPQLQRIQSEAESPFAVISSQHTAYGTLEKGENDSLWYSANHTQLGPHLYQYINGAEEAVLPLNSLAEIDVNSKGQLLISQLEYCDQHRLFYDLFILSEERDLEQITTCGRYRQAKWISDTELLALRYEAARPVLDILDASGNLIKTIWQGDEQTVLSSFDVSIEAAGDYKLVASIKFLNGSWNIYHFKNNVWQPLTDTDSLHVAPYFSEEGVLYVGAQAGQSEVYHLPLPDSKSKVQTVSSSKPLRLTHINTGLKYAIEKDESSLWAIRYNHDGDQVVEVSKGKYPAIYQKNYSRPTYQPYEERVNEEAKGYSPFQTLMPSYWFPVYLNEIDTKQVGFFTSGSDALNVHQYTLQLTAETITDQYLFNSSYIYDSRLFFGIEQSIDYRGVSGSIDVYQKNNQWIAGYMWPKLKMERQVYPYLAITQSRDYIFDGESDVALSRKNNDNWLALGLTLNDFRGTHWSADVSSGYQFNFSYETTEVIGNNIDEGSVLNLDAKFYYPLNGSHTIAQRLFVGVGFDSTSLFQLGGTISDPYIGPGIQVKQRRYPLRGYSSASEALRGENVLLHSFEYRLPVDWIDYSYMAPPVGVGGWSLRGFLDSGSAWGDSESISEIYTGVGVEAILDATLGYYLGLRVRIGIAKGFGSESDSNIYMEFGGSF